MKSTSTNNNCVHYVIHYMIDHNKNFDKAVGKCCSSRRLQAEGIIIPFPTLFTTPEFSVHCNGENLMRTVKHLLRTQAAIMTQHSKMLFSLIGTVIGLTIIYVLSKLRRVESRVKLLQQELDTQASDATMLPHIIKQQLETCIADAELTEQREQWEQQQRGAVRIEVVEEEAVVELQVAEAEAEAEVEVEAEVEAASAWEAAAVEEQQQQEEDDGGVVESKEDEAPKTTTTRRRRSSRKKE